jgi:fatty acid desaturase
MGETSEYMPLNEVRDTMRVAWYRSPLPPERLRELNQRSDMQGLIQAGGHIALVAGAGVLAFHFWQEHMWLWFVVALYCQGMMGSFFIGVAPHELGHGTVFRTKWLNKFFLYAISLFSWWDPFDYAVSHTYHHRYTLHPDGDREVLLPIGPGSGFAFILQVLTVKMFLPPTRTFSKGGIVSAIAATARSAFGNPGGAAPPSREWLQSLHTDQPAEYRKSMWWSRLQLLFHGSVLIVAILTKLWVLPLIISVFPFIGTFWLYFVGLPQHCGLRDNIPDFRKCARSMRLNPILEFLYWRMNWHVEHHMYAAVPCYNLKKLAREIADDMPEPRTLLGAWREMRETAQRQKMDPTYQFDTPLPETAGRHPAASSDELEGSIGELAPTGME